MYQCQYNTNCVLELMSYVYQLTVCVVLFVLYSYVVKHFLVLNKSRILIDDGKNIVNVYRDCVLDGGLRAFNKSSFNIWKPLDVKFAGEEGIDSGGIQREFMRLALRELKNLAIFAGDCNTKSLSLDYGSKLSKCLACNLLQKMCCASQS